MVQWSYFTLPYAHADMFRNRRKPEREGEDSRIIDWNPRTNPKKDGLRQQAGTRTRSWERLEKEKAKSILERTLYMEYIL